MKNGMSFVGGSGRSYRFAEVAEDSDWAAEAGVAVFAARGAYGWILVRAADLRGRADDLSAIWAWREARRYGASAVFLARSPSAADRAALLADLQAGMRPILSSAAAVLAA